MGFLLASKKVLLFVWKNSIAFFVITIIIILANLLFLKNLNIEAFPDPSPPIVEIVTLYPGRTAEEVEKQVTIPLEVALANSREIDKIYSISLYGLSDIRCKFSYNISYKEAKQEVLNRLSQAELPPSVSPSIIPNQIGEIMRYTIEGPLSLLDKRTIQDWIVSRYIKTAYGVEDVPSYGEYIKAYIVELKMDELKKYKISISDVVDAISRSNTNAGGRPIEIGNQYL